MLIATGYFEKKKKEIETNSWFACDHFTILYLFIIVFELFQLYTISCHLILQHSESHKKGVHLHN